MKALMFRILTGLTVGAWLIISLSCARDQQLVSITVQPSGFVVGDANTPIPADAGASTQLRALGTYIHPPVTKDITNQVAWGSSTIQIFTVNPTGLLTATGFACGNSLISATVQTNTSSGGRSSSGAVVTGNMTGTVVCPSPTAGETALTVNFAGTGTGTVGSIPGGLGCASNCSANFATGSTVTLTATPNAGSAFANWVGCDSTAGTSCTVLLTNTRTVTVTFN